MWGARQRGPMGVAAAAVGAGVLIGGLVRGAGAHPPRPSVRLPEDRVFEFWSPYETLGSGTGVPATRGAAER